jgi:DNA repair protein RadC
MGVKLYELKKIQSDFPQIKLLKSSECSDFIRQFYGDDLEIFESFFILLLNRANKTIGYAKISQGGISGTVVDVKLIAKYAIESLASSVILAHNHPSGTLNPSDADRQITTKVKQGLKLLDIEVLDHIILTADSYYSFSDNGLLY